jgi:hypothetical protein
VSIIGVLQPLRSGRFVFLLGGDDGESLFGPDATGSGP